MISQLSSALLTLGLCGVTLVSSKPLPQMSEMNGNLTGLSPGGNGSIKTWSPAKYDKPLTIYYQPLNKPIPQNAWTYGLLGAQHALTDNGLDTVIDPDQGAFNYLHPMGSRLYVQAMRGANLTNNDIWEVTLGLHDLFWPDDLETSGFQIKNNVTGVVLGIGAYLYEAGKNGTNVTSSTATGPLKNGGGGASGNATESGTPVYNIPDPTNPYTDVTTSTVVPDSGTTVSTGLPGSPYGDGDCGGLPCSDDDGDHKSVLDKSVDETTGVHT